MQKITEFIAHATRGESFKTNKYSLDGDLCSVIDSDNSYRAIPYEYGETEKHTKAIDLTSMAKKLENTPPLFSYFLDGSRRTYRVDDIRYEQKVFPIIAGQIGVGCCKREDKQLKRQSLEMHSVIVLPETADKDGGYKEQFFGKLKDDLCSMVVIVVGQIIFIRYI